MAVRLAVFLTIVLTSLCFSTARSETLLDLVKSISNLSKMAAIIESEELVRMQFMQRTYTAFLPSDAALERFQGKTDHVFVYAHLTNAPMLIQDIGATVTSDMTGNPELYVTKILNGKPSLTGWEDYDYYINNALVLVANQKAKSSRGEDQMLHIIDEVLAPTRVLGSATSPVRGYPTAADLLRHYGPYGFVGNTSIRLFKERVEELNQMQVFSSPGPNTFFIAVDQAITNKVLDEQVIHGHVIPDHALFTRPASSKEEEIESLAFTDNLKVLLKMVNVTPQKTPAAYYVTSNTVASDMQHTKGTAMARLVRTNIPVSNGVVHLIDRPLMTTAESIMSYLQEEGGQLSDFYRLFREHHPDLLNRLAVLSTDGSAITLFAPSNYAFSMVKKERLSEVSLNAAKLGELLKLHIVPRRLTTDEIAKASANGMFQVLTESHGRNLYFAVQPGSQAPGSSQLAQVSVEGAGVNASITTPNIVAENGVIHIINRILDIPSQTVLEKLQSNPSISLTYNLSSQGGFNAQLASRADKFTFFAPNNEAWAQVKKEMVSSYKKLFMGEFSYHVQTILQRHLIVGRDLSIKALNALTNNRTLPPNTLDQRQQLEMTRGTVYFQPRVSMTGNEYYLEWNGIVAKVVQSDMECVNGVVHIIDKVLMIRHDVMVAGSPPSVSITTTAALTTTAMLLLTATLR